MRFLVAVIGLLLSTVTNTHTDSLSQMAIGATTVRVTATTCVEPSLFNLLFSYLKFIIVGGFSPPTLINI